MSETSSLCLITTLTQIDNDGNCNNYCQDEGVLYSFLGSDNTCMCFNPAESGAIGCPSGPVGSSGSTSSGSTSSDCQSTMGGECTGTYPCCVDTDDDDTRNFVCVYGPSYDATGQGGTCNSNKTRVCLPDYCQTCPETWPAPPGCPNS